MPDPELDADPVEDPLAVPVEEAVGVRPVVTLAVTEGVAVAEPEELTEAEAVPEEVPEAEAVPEEVPEAEGLPEGLPEAEGVPDPELDADPVEDPLAVPVEEAVGVRPAVTLAVTEGVAVEEPEELTEAEGVPDPELDAVPVKEAVEDPLVVPVEEAVGVRPVVTVPVTEGEGDAVEEPEGLPVPVSVGVEVFVQNPFATRRITKARRIAVRAMGTRKKKDFERRRTDFVPREIPHYETINECFQVKRFDPAQPVSTLFPERDSSQQ